MITYRPLNIAVNFAIGLTTRRAITAGRAWCCGEVLNSLVKTFTGLSRPYSKVLDRPVEKSNKNCLEVDGFLVFKQNLFQCAEVQIVRQVCLVGQLVWGIWGWRWAFKESNHLMLQCDLVYWRHAEGIHCCRNLLAIFYHEATCGKQKEILCQIIGN